MAIKIKAKPETNSYILDIKRKEQRERVLQLLLKEGNCYVGPGSKLLKRKIEIDNRALEILIENEAYLGSPDLLLSLKSNEPTIQAKAKEEATIQTKLDAVNYDLDLRIWSRKENGATVYCSEVDGEIYSSPDLEKFAAFLKGEYLVQSKKDYTSLSKNPLTVFGVFSVGRDVVDSNKSIISHNGIKRKKKYEPVVKKEDHTKIIIDGADDTAQGANSSGLPKEVIYFGQAVLLFPLFLKGVHLGYEGLGAEAKEVQEQYGQTQIALNEIEAISLEYRVKLAQIFGIALHDLGETPQQVMQEVNNRINALKVSGADDGQLNEVIDLTNQFYNKTKEKVEEKNLTDVMFAHMGWAAMTSMMASVGIYEMQAILNVLDTEGVQLPPELGSHLIGQNHSQIGVSEEIPSDVKQFLNQFEFFKGNENLSALDLGASYAGCAGQILMTFYALYKVKEEGKEWKEAKEDLENFKANSHNIDELSKNITEKLLQGKVTNHRNQTYGNAALSLGQAMMAVGGPVFLATAPVLLTGLGLTLGGVALNSASELRYNASFGIDEELDDVEKGILNKKPNFTFAGADSPQLILKKHFDEKTLAFTILGHLRAPQYALHLKYISENANKKGSFGKVVGALGGRKISKWINNPPMDSVNLIKDDPIIEWFSSSYDIDVLKVETADLDLAVEKYNALKRDGNLNNDQILKILQEDFVQAKYEQGKPNPKSVKEICAEILEKDDAASVYLTKKLMRAAANGDLTYSGNIVDSSVEIKKDRSTLGVKRKHEEIEVAKLDIEKFDEDQLEEYLTQRRAKKNMEFMSKNEKKPVLAKAHKQDLHSKKSDHFRPFEQTPETLEASANLDVVTPVLGQENVTGDLEQKKILKQFDQAAKLSVSKEKVSRIAQTKKQDDLLAKVENQGTFVLVSTKSNNAKHQTIFTYAHPDHPLTSPPTADYESNKITYIRDDYTGKIDVVFNENKNVLFVEKPSEKKNGVVTHLLDENIVRRHGDKENSIFKSFKTAEVPNPSVAPSHALPPPPIVGKGR